MRTGRRLAPLSLVAVLVAGMLVVSAEAGRAAEIRGAASVMRIWGTGGDPITRGRVRVYTPSNSTWIAAHDDGRRVDLRLTTSKPHVFWNLSFAAPDKQRLRAGVTYRGATRAAFQKPGTAGFSLTGESRGCNTSRATFTVRKIAFAAEGWITSFHAAFRQYCEGAPKGALARGYIEIENGPAPGPLTASVVPTGVVISPEGNAEVRGTLRCTRKTYVDAHALVLQAQGSTTVGGDIQFLHRLCGPKQRHWTSPIRRAGEGRLRPGTAVTVSGSLTADNLDYAARDIAGQRFSVSVPAEPGTVTPG